METKFIRARELADTDLIVERSSGRRKPTITKIRATGVVQGACINHGVHIVTMHGNTWCVMPETLVEIKV